MKMEPAPDVPVYGIVVEKDVDVPMRDGARLKADVFRPDDGGTFPAILNLGPYQKDKLWVPPGNLEEKHSPWMHGAQERYRRLLKNAQQRRKLIVVAALSLLALSLVLAPQLGSEFLPALVGLEGVAPAVDLRRDGRPKDGPLRAVGDGHEVLGDDPLLEVARGVEERLIADDPGLGQEVRAVL